MATHMSVQHATAFIVTLMITKSCEQSMCPSQCQCGAIYVKCNGKGLRTVPKDIPLSARKIDLSDNPQIRIPNDYFLQFKHLFILSLRNCSLRGPIYLPRTVVDLKLEENLFSWDTLKEIFSFKMHSLKRINLENNHMSAFDTKRVMKILPVGLKMLILTGNRLTVLTREEMLRFKGLNELRAKSCGIESVEASTFDDMKNLSTLVLDGNYLNSLPASLFKYNLKLVNLYLNYNKLPHFNATKLGLQHVKNLKLSNNRIKTFDLRNLKPYKVMLNGNKIQQLKGKIFLNNTNLVGLCFSNNEIHFISHDAFRGIKVINQLLLNNNRLQYLPKGLLNDVTINKIFLQNNHLSNLTGVFDGIRNNRVIVILTKNKGFTSLNGSDFQHLPLKSIIYLNCAKLTKFSCLSEMKATVLCALNTDARIYTMFDEGLSCGGYQCKHAKIFAGYNCRTCKRGYYNMCKRTHDNIGICIKCPTGSYYQDEPASTKCKTCRSGQFVPPERSPGKDASDCQTCPQGTNTTIVAGTRACKCLHGYARQYRFGPCYKCTNEGFNCSQDYQILNDGFWMTWQGTIPQHTSKARNQDAKQTTCEGTYRDYMKNLDITGDDYDRKTVHYNCQMPLPTKCPMSGSCLGGINPSCSVGYRGVVCAVCDRGYSLQFNQCVQCPKIVWAVLKFIGCIALFGLLCFIISLTDEVTVDLSTTDEQRSNTQINQTFADIILSSLKILIGFYQILIAIISKSPSFYWPSNVKTVVKILRYIQFEVIKLPSLRCINSEWKIDAIDEFWIILIFIIIIPILAVIYYFIKSLYIHYQYSSPSEAKRQRYVCGRNCIKFVALFLFVSYTLISRKIVEILPISCHTFCTAKQNGTCVHSMSFLRSDYSIPCPTMADHKATLIIGYICLVIPLGLPIVLYLLLLYYAPRQQTGQQLQSGSSSVDCIIVNDNEDCFDLQNDSELPMNCDNHRIVDSSDAMMTSALQFAYENYHSAYWYWEVTEMIRKLLMTVGIVLFLRHTKIGLGCTIIVAMIFAILHAVMKPFKTTFESGTQLLSLVLIPLNLAFGAVVQSKDTQNPSIINKKSDSKLFGVFFGAMNSLIFIVIVGRLCFIIGMKIKSRMNSSR